MRRFYTLIPMLVALIIPTVAWADDLKVNDTFDADGMTFTVTNISPTEVRVGTGEETKTAINKDTEGSLKIPTSVVGTDGNKYSVTTIGRYAFCECSKITDIDIPNSVISIGMGAFSNCSNLKEIVIPNSVTRIPMWAFYGCKSLTNVTIPNSVKTILDAAFFL